MHHKPWKNQGQFFLILLLLLFYYFFFQPHDTYKPPTPGGFSLNSVTSFNVDEVANRNEERLRRLELIQRGGGQGGRGSLQGDPDQVLQRFMDERRYHYQICSNVIFVNKHFVLQLYLFYF